MTPAPSTWVPERKDVIWIEFDPQVGEEMQGEHPMVVLSTKAFNEKTGIVIGLPMTHAKRHETNPFAVPYTYSASEGTKTGYVLTHQPKSFDWRKRGARPHPLKAMPADLFQTCLGELNSIISLV